jgi:hypothetical protein
MKVSGQLHAPAGLRRLGGLQSRSGRCGVEKNLLLLLGIERRFFRSSIPYLRRCPRSWYLRSNINTHFWQAVYGWTSLFHPLALNKTRGIAKCPIHYLVTWMWTKETRRQLPVSQNSLLYSGIAYLHTYLIFTCRMKSVCTPFHFPIRIRLVNGVVMWSHLSYFMIYYSDFRVRACVVCSGCRKNYVLKDIWKYTDLWLWIKRTCVEHSLSMWTEWFIHFGWFVT